MRKLLAIFSTLTWITTASAQPNPDDFNLPDVEPDPLYHVELILFAFNEGNRFEEDFLHGIDNPRLLPVPALLDLPDIELESIFGFRPEVQVSVPDTQEPPETASEPAPEPAVAEPPPGQDPILPLETLQDRLQLIETDARQQAEASTGNEVLPAAFRPLATSELELGNAAARLNRRPYTLLGHAGWEQTGVDADRAVKLDLRRLGITNPTGTIELYLRRFLHVAVDFDFYDGSGTFWTAANGFGVAPFQYAQSFKLVDERNAIRSGELHSIDHPLFGVLVRITPAPEPEAVAGSEATGGPAG